MFGINTGHEKCIALLGLLFLLAVGIYRQPFTSERTVTIKLAKI